MKPSLKNIKAIMQKFVDGEDRYQNLTFDELDTYYKFAASGYVTSGKFIYPDTQSMAKYIDVKLVLKYLTALKDRDGVEMARKEYNRLQSCGYLYTRNVGGREFLCTCEGQSYLLSLLENKDLDTLE